MHGPLNIQCVPCSSRHTTITICYRFIHLVQVTYQFVLKGFEIWSVFPREEKMLVVCLRVGCLEQRLNVEWATL